MGVRLPYKSRPVSGHLWFFHNFYFFIILSKFFFLNYCWKAKRIKLRYSRGYRWQEKLGTRFLRKPINNDQIFSKFGLSLFVHFCNIQKNKEESENWNWKAGKKWRRPKAEQSVFFSSRFTTVFIFSLLRRPPPTSLFVQLRPPPPNFFAEVIYVQPLRMKKLYTLRNLLFSATVSVPTMINFPLHSCSS